MERRLKRLQLPRHGIQYIIDPGVREELSPFVFFDAGTMIRNDKGLFIGSHPHSGIGIITYFDGADLIHDDSGNNDDIIRDGGVQWIQTGGAVWHQENYHKKASVKTHEWEMSIYQLWLQLPPELEESEVEYQNIQPEGLRNVGNVKVLTGTYKGVTSALKTPYDMTYLDVKLNAGENFEFQTQENQTTGFVFPRYGQLALYGEALPLRHLSILEENEGLIKVTAQSEAKFIIVMAAPQHYPIVTQGGSIHTDYDSLERSLQRIRSSRTSF